MTKEEKEAYEMIGELTKCVKHTQKDVENLQKSLKETDENVADLYASQRIIRKQLDAFLGDTRVKNNIATLFSEMNAIKDEINRLCGLLNINSTFNKENQND